MKIVATAQRFLAVCADVCPEMVLIGAFVFAETRVAIEAIAGILGRDMRHRGIEPRDGCHGLCHTFLEIFPAYVILFLVFVEPIPVVVGREFMQIA